MLDLYNNIMKSLYKKFLLLVGAFFLVSTAHAQENDAYMLFFKNAEQFRSKGEYANAIKDYEHAAALNDTSALIYYWKGWSHSQLNQNAEAVSALERAVDLDPNYLQTYNTLLNVYNKVENTDKIVETLSRLIEVEKSVPKKVEYTDRMLQLLVQQGNYVDVLNRIKKARALAPGNLSFPYYEAQALNGLARYNETIKLLEGYLPKVATTDKKALAQLNYELGYAYHHVNQFDKSREAFEKANIGPFRALISKLQPDHYYNIAVGYSKIFEYETASAVLETALKIDPTYARAYDLLADNAIKQEHHFKGIEYYEKAVQGLADRDEYLKDLYTNKLIPTLINAEQFEEAVRKSDEALEKYPTDRTLKYLKAISLHHLNRNQEAISIMETLLNSSQTVASMEIGRMEAGLYSFASGIMYRQLGKLDQAKESFLDARKAGSFANASQYAYEQILEKEATERANKM